MCALEEASLRALCVCGCLRVVAHRLAGCNLEEHCIHLVVLIDSLFVSSLRICVCVSAHRFTLLLPLFQLFLGLGPLRSCLSFLRESVTTRHCRVRGENILEIFLGLFGHLGVSNVAKHVVMDTCCQEIHHPTLYLLPRCVVGVCNVGFFSSAPVMWLQ